MFSLYFMEFLKISFCISNCNVYPFQGFFSGLLARFFSNMYLHVIFYIQVGCAFICKDFLYHIHIPFYLKKTPKVYSNFRRLINGHIGFDCAQPDNYILEYIVLNFSRVIMVFHSLPNAFSQRDSKLKAPINYPFYKNNFLL